MQITIVDYWSIRVSSIDTSLSTTASVTASVELAVDPAATVTVKNERYENLPLFQPDTPWGWTKGVRLEGMRTQETTAKGAA